MNLDFALPNPKDSRASIEGSWVKKRWWDWNGIAVADAPIVAVSILHVKNRIEWARSEKNKINSLDIRLLLGGYDSIGKDVQVGFSMGDNGPRWRTILDDPEHPPIIAPVRDVLIGKPFLFCASFGTPKIELWGLLIFRDQVVGARNGLWHIKEAYRSSLSPEWLKILTVGRSGWFES
jgi:hypothetical protein